MMIQIAITNDKGEGLEWLTAKIPEGMSIVDMGTSGHLQINELGMEKFCTPILKQLAKLLGKYDKSWVDRVMGDTRVSSLIS